MEFTFLLPLTVGLTIGYKAWGSSHDIAHLAVIFAIVNLLVSLLLAPWEIQILLLILTAIIAKPLWQKFENKGGPWQSENSPKTDAKLHYRGISYESKKPAILVNNAEKITKCYRGVDYECSQKSTQVANNVPDKVIKYRGVDIKTKIKD